MSIAPIGGLPAFPQVGTTGPEGARPSLPGFGDALANSLQQVSDLEHRVDAMAADVATGGPTKVHELMIATTESALAVDMLVAVRDRGLEAYNEIMRMQL